MPYCYWDMQDVICFGELTTDCVHTYIYIISTRARKHTHPRTHTVPAYDSTQSDNSCTHAPYTHTHTHTHTQDCVLSGKYGSFFPYCHSELIYKI